MSNQKKTKVWVIVAIIFVAALSRILPHPSNFTPIVAMALFGGAYLKNKNLAFILVLVALFLSDFILNNTLLRAYYPDHQGLVFISSYMLWVYGSMLAIVTLGILILKKISISRVLLSAVGASVLFYLVTNFGAMLGDPMYPKSMAGLSASLFAGLPFFKNALVGNLLYTGVLFGAYELGISWYAKRSLAN